MSRSPEPESTQRPQLILIADDSRDAREMYSEYLTFMGCTTALVADGREAIDKAALILPDLIVMDLAMPRLNGFDAIVALKRNQKTSHIPIIALSAFTMFGERRRAEEAGADLFLTKPCLPEDLLARIRELLSRS